MTRLETLYNFCDRCYENKDSLTITLFAPSILTTLLDNNLKSKTNKEFEKLESDGFLQKLNPSTGLTFFAPLIKNAHAAR